MNAGDTLGHYRIIEPLGHGGMGEVYLAEDAKLNRRVALKTLPAAFVADPDRRRRFEREAQAIAALNHPGIVTIHSIEVDGPTPFLTMEYVEGRPLKQTIPAGGAPVDTLLKTGIGIADAIAAAHQRGIVHRDLKPANVIVGPDGRVKVLDFGLAKVHETELAAAGEAATRMVEDDLTGEGKIVGTVAYMSPEQAEGKSVDQRSDIFSLGVMLHEMATGDRPFKGDTEISIISAIIKDTPSAVTDSRPDLPLPFARIVKRCLVKDPQRRYQSARDLQNDLEDLKQDVDSGVLSAPSRAAAPPAPSAPRRVPRWAVYGAAGAIVLAAGVGGWWTLKPPPVAAAEFVPDQFTRLTESGSATLAALSADGRYVVHVKHESQRPGLWVRQTGTTSDVRILAPFDGRVDGVAFSPDGAFVYYNTYPLRSGVATLYKIPVLGGTPVRIVEDVDSGVALSPDGARLAFLRGRPAENAAILVVAAVDGTGSRDLANTRGATRLNTDTPAWSPDGKTIVVPGRVVVNGAPKARLLTVDADTGAVSHVGGDWTFIRGVAWMPDGRSLIMCGLEDESTPAAQIWQVSWPGGARRRITSGVNGYEDVSLSADGRTIATIERESHSNIWIYPMAGGPGRQITSTVRGNPGAGGVAWTPSGRIIYAASPGNAPNQIWAMNADGTGVVQLTNLRAYAALPAVSPDEKWVYFNGGDDKSNIWRMPLQGGDPVRLTSKRGEWFPIVSPDGKWVYFSADEEGLTRATKMPAEGGTTVALTPPEVRFTAGAVSADGTTLYGTAWNAAGRRTQFAAVPTAGGAVAFLDSPRGARGLTPDEKSWVLIDVIGGVPGVYVVPRAGGKERLLVDLGQDQAWRGAISPDGKNAAVVRGRSTNDVILIKAK